MHVAIIRRTPKVTFSMDVYADQLVAGLRSVRPDWTITEIFPQPWWRGEDGSWKSGTGVRKYYERFWRHPRNTVAAAADIFHVVDHTDAHIGYWLKKHQKPFIITCHDLVQFVYPEILQDQSRFPKLSLAVWKYSVSGMRHANNIIAVSENTKSDIERYLTIDPQSIRVIPNAVSEEFCQLPPQQRLEARKKYRKAEKIYLLNVGSTHQRKNILTVLKVLKALLSKGFNAVLWKAGGNFMPIQQQFIEANELTGSVMDLGMPDRFELIRIYNSADILLAPSLYEGFGLTVLEAMACGLPVITSNTSSLPEVGGSAVTLVDPLDIEQIVESVIELILDKQRYKSSSEQGVERARLFKWQQTAEFVAQVYERAAKL